MYLTKAKLIDKKVKIFSHNDMDGYGAPIIIKSVYANPNTVYCQNSEINYRLTDFIYLFMTIQGKRRVSFPKDKLPDKLFITDIVVRKEMFDLLAVFAREFPEIDIVYIDHHHQSQYGADYYNGKEKNLTIIVDADQHIKRSATGLTYEYLEPLIDQLYGHRLNFPRTELQRMRENLLKFSQMVTLWDTWVWKEFLEWDKVPMYYGNLGPMIELSKQAVMHDKLFYFYGPKEWEKRIVGNMFSTEPQGSDKMLAEMLLEKAEHYIQEKLKLVEKRYIALSDDEHYTVGVVFAEEHISELGNRVCENDSMLDCAIVVNTGTSPFKVSGRTISKDVNMTMIMKKLFNGGGHPMASGGTVSNKQMTNIFSQLFS